MSNSQIPPFHQPSSDISIQSTRKLPPKPRSIRDRDSLGLPDSVKSERNQINQKVRIPSHEFYNADFSMPATDQSAAKKDNPSSLCISDADIEAPNQQDDGGIIGAVFLNALKNLHSSAHSDPESKETAVTAPLKKKLSRRNLLNTESIDYSIIFPPSSYFTESPQKVFIMRIEDLNPILLEPNNKFCIADCYIILIKPDTPEEEWSIHTWIGNESESDKRFCAALYTISLRSHIPFPSTIHRESPNEESIIFRTYFPTLTYTQADQATLSGLYIVQEPVYSIKLYVVVGGFQLKLIKPTVASLCRDCVFVLDTGLEIFQWNGKNSTVQHKSKTGIWCDGVIKGERMGRGRHFVVEQWEFEEGSNNGRRFAEILGWSDFIQPFPTEIYATTIPIPTIPKLYPVNLSLTLTPITTKLTRKHLNTDGACILDAGDEVWVWIGKACDNEIRGVVNEALAKLIPVRRRNPWLSLQRIHEQSEPEIFKLHFPDFHPPSSASPIIDATVLKVDVGALYVSELVYEEKEAFNNRELINFSTFVWDNGKFNECGIGMGSCWSGDTYIYLCVYTCSSKSLQCTIYLHILPHSPSLPHSHFLFKTAQETSRIVHSLYAVVPEIIILDRHREDLYLLNLFDDCLVQHLGRYKSRDHGNEKKVYKLYMDTRGTTRAVQIEDGEMDVRCGYFCTGGEEVYLWLGNACENEFEKCVERIIDDLSNHEEKRSSISLNLPDPHVNVVLDKKTRKLSLSTSSLSDYSQSRRSSTRIIDGVMSFFTEPVAAISSFIDALSQSKLTTNKIVSSTKSYKIIHQSNEPSAFFTQYPSLQPPSPPFPSKKPPRILICTCLPGYFSIHEPQHPIQSDLHPSACAIIDPGFPSRVFIWVGKGASDVVIKYTRKSVDVWFGNCNDGRGLGERDGDLEGDVEWVYDGREGERFRRLFLGWE